MASPAGLEPATHSLGNCRRLARVNCPIRRFYPITSFSAKTFVEYEPTMEVHNRTAVHALCADTLRTPVRMTERGKLTDGFVKSVVAPAGGRAHAIYYDGEVKGFGLRVTKGGARSFVLNYRARGIERRYP